MPGLLWELRHDGGTKREFPPEPTPKEITLDNICEDLMVPKLLILLFLPLPPQSPILLLFLLSPFVDMTWRQPLTWSPKKANIIIITDSIKLVFILCQASDALNFIQLLPYFT